MMLCSTVLILLTFTFKNTQTKPMLYGEVHDSTDDWEDEDLSGDFDFSEEPTMYDDYTSSHKKHQKSEDNKIWKINLNRADLFEGDIKLSLLQKLKHGIDEILPPQPLEQPNNRVKRAARSKDPSLLWKHNTIYYKIANVFDKKTKLQIKRGIKHWKKSLKNCLKFVRLDRQEGKEKNISREKFDGGPVEHILFTKTEGCWSTVGRIDSIEDVHEVVPGQQLISIGDGCGEKGTVIHEIGHAVGFWHEQSRRDRDKFIRVVKGNILTNQKDQFKRLARSEADSMGYAYDFWSIMHYGTNFFSINDRATIKVQKPYKYLQANIGQRKALSYLDIAQVRAMYKCNVIPSPERQRHCAKRTTKGRDYRGNLDYTESGVMCQPWNKQYPHKHDYKLENSMDGLGKHNFCRNPGGEKERPWCFTTYGKNMNKDWEYCDIQLCES